jgi:S-adenosylmethionine decarboxylase
MDSFAPTIEIPLELGIPRSASLEFETLASDLSVIGISTASATTDSDNEEGTVCSSAGSVVSDINSFDDTHSTPAYVPGTFEGPEKTMEVCFRPGVGHPDGLRALTRAQLDFLCNQAKCSILSKISSNYIDAYVLSESSLFIYKEHYIMKTCGTTTLLRCLSSLLQFADELGMELTWVGYSRKNLMFPTAQHWPHSSFGDEIKYLSHHAKLQDRLRGSAHILGPVTGDHWFVYVADHSEVPHSLTSPTAATERTLNMMMFDMHPDVAQIFFQKNTENAKDMTVKSGIAALCPGATIDETAFTPCGYSMNAILHDAYSTIHVTPEASCSYVSFETNTSLQNYTPTVRNVLNVFKPKRFVLTLFGDDAALKAMTELPTDARHIVLPPWGTYVRTSLSSTKVENDLSCLMGCYTVDEKMLPPCSSPQNLRDRGYSIA